MTLPTRIRREAPTDSQLLASEIDSTYKQFMYMNEHYRSVLTMWVMHTHLRDELGQFMPQRTGRPYFGSALAGCGKTLAMELTTMMAHNGEIHINPTQFGLVTAINVDRGTPGIDEIDRLFGNSGNKAADTQTVILAGYKSGASVTRQRNGEADRQNIHGPMCIGGKNLQRFRNDAMFETLRTRSFIIALERKPRSVRVDRFRSEVHGDRIIRLSERLKRWGQRYAFSICSRDVDDEMMRIGIDNRDEEIWSSLFRVASFVGGEWPKRIEMSARAMLMNEWGDDEVPVLSPAEEMLSYVRLAFKEDEPFLPTRIVVERVLELADKGALFRREWTNAQAACIALARDMAVNGVPTTERGTWNGQRARGYYADDLRDSLDSLDTEDTPQVQPVDEWDWSDLDD